MLCRVFPLVLNFAREEATTALAVASLVLLGPGMGSLEPPLVAAPSIWLGLGIESSRPYPSKPRSIGKAIPYNRASIKPPTGEWHLDGA